MVCRGKLLCAILCSLLVANTFVYAQNPAVTITVNAAANRHPISPAVYGVAYASAAALADLNVALHRYGGNNTSRYNWQLNADNRGADWYFESIAEPSSVAGERGDTFIANSQAAGAQAMLTVPTIGWVARLGANRAKLSSFSIARYGAQTGNDWQWFPDAGNGVRTNGQNVTGNDPNDASTPADSTFQQGWVQHLVNRWGTAAGGGLRYYILDNEPSIWHATHRDVRPTGATMDEIRDKLLDYGAKIKAVDPSALVVAPEEWGWSGYLFSGYDQQYGSLHGWSFLPDRSNHGGWDYLPWLLDQLRQNDLSTGQRKLDVFSVHYYPQGGEFSNDTSAAMQLRRNRSTRSLWDANYVDETWINDKVMLVPRLKNWVNTYYPGTQTAITEYNWGAEGHINGATAQADILGIFGREGLDMATRWTTPDASTPTYKAMKMYRNYDGNHSTFGDTSVAASTPNPDNVSAFAAVRSTDGALTVMAVNKYLSGGTPATINLSNFNAQGQAQVWQLTSSNSITRLANVSVSGGSLSATLPSQSVTLFVIPATGAANAPPIAVASASPQTGPAPLSVTFDGRGSSDSDGMITAYAWDFGDGALASGATGSHTYTTPGDYAVTLTVTDNAGATASTTLTVVARTPAVVINPPSNLTASVASRTVTLRWADNSSNEAGFYVERASGSGAFARVGQVGASVTTFSETLPRGTYYYRVQAFVSAGGMSYYSNKAQVKVK